MKNTKVRPYWHVDLKWLLALLALPAIAAVLLLTVTFRITATEPAVEILSHALAGLTASEGIDSDEGFEQLLQDLGDNGEEVVNFGGVPVTITAQDLEDLSPREVRLKIFTAFAERFYDLGAEGLAEDVGADAEAVAQAQSDAVFISPLTSDGHRQIGKYLAIATFLALALLGAVTFFSYGLGRLVSPGVLLLIAGLPGILFMAIASNTPDLPTGVVQPQTAEGPIELAGSFAGFVAPLILPYLASTYMAAFLLGAVMLLLALALKLLRKKTSTGTK